MRQALLFTTLALGFGILGCQKTPDYGPLPDYNPVIATYTFSDSTVWRDEFDYTGKPDPARWGYDIGGSGWGNNELEYYTNSLNNARVDGGKLIIEARKEPFNNNKYTSARLVTKKKGDWQYGRVVVRAKLPQGRGTWPAIWMLATNQSYGTDYWPDNGEIDIMEHVGYDPTVIHATAHTKAYYFKINTQKSATTKLPTAFTDFHDYVLEWTPTQLKMLIDTTPYFVFDNPGDGWQKWPFDKPFHLLLNIAVGGDWGGQKGIDDSVFPQRMEVDYVRVYGLVKK